MTPAVTDSPLGTRRCPLHGVGPHPMLSSRPPARIRVTDGDVPPDAADGIVLPIGPNRWWIVDDEEPTETQMADPREAIELSHAMTRIRLQGDRAVTVLVAGITIDLHPSVFTVGSVAVTPFRDIFVVLHARADAEFDLYTPRSSAPSLWEWLVDAHAGLESTSTTN
ncbi:hypothetical protein BH24ACT5_BH24ACT5_25640 [soil metagenome]